MRITYIDGHYSMDIDGEEFVNIDYDKQKKICHKLVDKVSEGVLQRFIENACIEMGEYADLGQCETCVEYIDKYVINI